MLCFTAFISFPKCFKGSRTCPAVVTFSSPFSGLSARKSILSLCSLNSFFLFSFSHSWLESDWTPHRWYREIKVLNRFMQNRRQGMKSAVRSEVMLQPHSRRPLFCVGGESPEEQPGVMDGYTHALRRTFLTVAANSQRAQCWVLFWSHGDSLREEEILNYPWWLCCVCV